MIEHLLRTSIIISLILVLLYSGKKNLIFLKKSRKITKNRLYLSFPVGTILVITINLAIYLCIQRGLWHFNTPLWIPFTTSGIQNITGTLIGSWTHIGPSHLFSNMLGTMIFAPIAEIIFNTKKTKINLKKITKRDITSLNYLEKISKKPFYRAIVLFPLTWFFLGIIISLSSPVGLGFSGIVFGLIGFILIIKPLLVIYLYLIQILINNLLSAFTEPIIITKTVTETTEPIWVNLGVWAHVIGFLLGTLLGISLYLLKEDLEIKKPEPSYVFFATLIIGFTKGLDWLFKMESRGEYVLYSALGFLFILILAFLFTEFWEKYPNTYSKKIEYLGNKTRFFEETKSIFNDHRLYLFILFSIILLMSSFMVTAKTINDPPAISNDSIEINNYEIWYEEKTGVLVYNEEKNIYSLLINDRELFNQRKKTFYLGNLLNEEKISLKNIVFKSINQNEVKIIEISYDKKSTKLFKSTEKETGIRVNNNSVSMKLLKNNSIQIKINDTHGSEAIINSGSNETKELKKNIEIYFEEHKLVLEDKSGIKTIIGEIIN